MSKYLCSIIIDNMIIDQDGTFVLDIKGQEHLVACDQCSKIYKENKEILEKGVPDFASLVVDKIRGIELAKSRVKDVLDLPFEEARSRKNREFEKSYLLHKLKMVNYDISEAARLSDLDVDTFTKKMEEHSIVAENKGPW